jgi:putative ABC transport system permease protein
MRLFRRAQYWLHHGRHAADLDDEMAFHRSMTSGPAFGNATLAREDARAVWASRRIDEAWQDVRYALRSMRRQPGFAIAAIGIIALGTGATTCVFGLLDSLVVKSLPVERPDRLVRLGNPSFSHPIFAAVRANVPIFEGVFAWNIDRAYVDWTASGGELVSTDVLEATEEMFTTLRVRPVIGRAFDASDTTAAVISHAAWTRRFGADPAVVGRAIRVGDASYTVVGITPAGFFGVAPGLAPEVMVPLASRHTAAAMAAPGQAWLHIMGRLKDGIRIEQADAVLQTVWPGIMESTTNPGMPADRRARYLARRTGLESGRSGFSRVRNQFGEPLRLLMALVTLLLAIACASVANLLLARGVARRKEIAVRLAIGAKRARIFRQLLTEALVLTLAGAGIGLLLASWAGGLLVAFLTTTSERLALDTSPGWRLAGFAVALAVAVSAVSALLPSLTATRADVTGALKETGQPGARLLRRWSAGKILVALQVALAVVLLAGAAVFSRSLARVLAQDTGMETGSVLVVSPDALAAGYEGAALREFHARMLARLRESAAVESAALSLMPPISNTAGNWTQSIAVDGIELPPTDARYVYFNAVSPRYFETVGMALRRGRDIADTDAQRSPRVAIVNESLARRFFAGQDAIGHRISIGKAASRKDLEIVGVVQDAKYRTMQEPTRAIGYLPVAQLDEGAGGPNLVADVRVPNLPLAGPAIRQAMRSLDPRVPMTIETIGDRIRESTISERVIAVLTAALGIAALVLASAGLYGLLAYAVSRHWREIGIRMALGARPASLLWMVQRESLVLAGLGIAAGLGGALALGRFIRTMLFEVTPGDPIALAAASAVMLVVATGAAYLPARRAASVDPAVALKRDY